tara:strand:+ start:33 stop:206 length:174 start_codon:yes stop_codon:yes gene_type:complete
MVAGINGASNSPANKKKTTNVAWSPLPPKKKKETDLEKVIKTKKNKKQTIDDILNSI